jgi:hypothetical protein
LLNYIDLLGARFAYGGRGPQYYDCYGLAIEIQKRVGVTIPDIYSPAEVDLIHGQIDSSKALFTPIEKEDPFCLVLFQIHPQFVTHVGVVLEDCKRFIHVMQRRFVTVERLHDWQPKARGFYRCKSS